MVHNILYDQVRGRCCAHRMFEGIAVKISRIAVYRNDGTGRLRLARHCIRYSYENQNSDPALRQVAADRRHATECCAEERRRLSLARAPLAAAQRGVDDWPKAGGGWPEVSDGWPEASDRLDSIRARAARVRDRIRRLQSFPQYRCDPEMHMWVRLYMQLEGMLGHVIR